MCACVRACVRACVDRYTRTVILILLFLFTTVACSRLTELTASEGAFGTAGLSYGNNESCSWKIEVPSGQVGHIQFRTHARTNTKAPRHTYTRTDTHTHSRTRAHTLTHVHTQPIIPAPVWLQRMRLHFSKFDLESESNCTYDRVKIYDGSSASAQLRGSYCGNNTPGDVVSSGSTMLVSFKSNKFITKSGFKILYSLGESTLV